MAQDLDLKQVTKAVSALILHIQKQANTIPKGQAKSIFVDADPISSTYTPASKAIYLVITTKKFFQSSHLKPVTLKLPYSPYPPGATCLLITKDPHAAYEEKLQGYARVQNVKGLSWIRKECQSYEQRRRLRDGDEFGSVAELVLCDERVIPSCPDVLGKAFYSRKQSTPIPLDIKNPSTARKKIDDAFKCAFVKRPNGDNASIRIGWIDQPVEEIVANALAVWEQGVTGGMDDMKKKKLVKEGLDGVRAVYVKTGESVALPVWWTRELYGEADIKQESTTKGDSQVKRDFNTLEENTQKKKDEKKNTEIEERKQGKRAKIDDIETEFEARRARKLAKKNVKRPKSVASV